MVRNCYLIGYPVKQSPSPDIINAAFTHKKYPYHYERLAIPREGLAEFVKSFRKECGLFFNVTIPHKVEISRFVDKVDEDAKKIGAVSCVLNEGGKLWGYNTDFVGFSRALDKFNLSLEREKVDVLGAGGAAGPAVYSLIKRGANVRILNRTLEHARKLATRFGCDYWTLDAAGDHETILVVNTTPLGMFPNVGESVLTKEQIGKYKNVVDIVYNPEETLFMKMAREAGCNVLEGFGLEMLIGLLESSFIIGTGNKPDRELMVEVAKRKLHYK